MKGTLACFCWAKKCTNKVFSTKTCFSDFIQIGPWYAILEANAISKQLSDQIFVQKWLRNKLLHFWLAALANSAYLVFPHTSMYSGFYWKLFGNALIKLDPPKHWSNRAPLHVFSSRRAQSTFAKRWRIENWKRNVIKLAEYKIYSKIQKYNDKRQNVI